MSFETIVTIGVVPRVSGGWASAAVAGTRQRIVSITYPIMAASVSADLDTNVFTIDIPAAGGAQIITLEKMLPNLQELVSVVNNGVNEAYSLYSGPLPAFIKRADGWYWDNPTPATVTVTYGNESQQQLYLGEATTSGQRNITIPTESRIGPFRPDPRLGAVTQDLTIIPGQSRKLKLPLAGGYRDGVMLRPIDEYVNIGNPGSTARLEVNYSSIGSRIEVTTLIPSEIEIASDISI